MPHIGVLFEIRRVETRPGECVSVVGNRPELGNWDPFDYKAAAGLQLRTGAAQYPCWAMPAPVWIELGSCSNRDKVPTFSDSEGEDTEEEEGEETREYDEQAELEHETSTPTSPQNPGATSMGNSAVADAVIRLEYKYVRDRRQLPGKEGPSIQWEESIANRRVMIPQEHGSIWIVSDMRFNDNCEPQITRTTLAEVLARRGDLDPEWTCHQEDIDAPEWAMPHREDLSSPGSVATSCSRHTTSTVFMM